MCGRFLNKLPPAETARLFRTRNVAPNYPARFNIAPTDPVLAVRFNAKTGERSLDALRWGLVPYGAKDMSMSARLINARSETLATTPVFRDAFQRRRCLIPASGFYEWRKDGKLRVPYAIVPTDAPLFAFAGLWENWRDPSRRALAGAPQDEASRRALAGAPQDEASQDRALAGAPQDEASQDAEWVRSCAIVTGEPNETLAPIHQRMPVILPEEAWAQWLGETPAGAADLGRWLKPYPAERMRVYPVSPRVNSVKNDDASLPEPLMAEGGIPV
jgi:putative SOS response-associated peptidase YedK